MRRKIWYLIGLSMLLFLSGCGAAQSQNMTPTQPLISDNVHIVQQPGTTPLAGIPQQVATPTRTPTPHPKSPASSPPVSVPPTGIGAAPYGQPPAPTTLELQLTQKLFNQMNSDRAARGLYSFVWNSTLAAGARLHSWNMKHCGFSHTCPDGLDQCTRIANEGFAGFTDCGECIGLAGPSADPWTNVYNVQESMINEPPNGWHRIHLTSTTLHRVGVGIYVDSSGWVWFTEDMVS